MICYLDMDGVLVNFVEGSMKVHDKWIRRGYVEWDFNQQLGIPDKQFWEPLGHDFWANLEWHDEGQELLKGITTIFGLENIVLMTNPCATKGCADGKIEWIKKNVPQFKRRFFIGPAKYMCASPRHMLIDDSDHNIEKFEDHGGYTALVPRSWNKNRHLTTMNAFNVDDFLKTVMEKVERCSTV